MFMTSLQKKTFLSISLGLFAMVSLSAQEVSWKQNVKHIEKDLYEITFTATVPPGYYMYDLGPYPEDAYVNVTTFEFGSMSRNIRLEGKPYHITKPQKKFDETFGVEIGKMYGKAEFGQKVRMIAGKEGNIKGVVESSICNDNSCMPPAETEFNVVIK